MPSTSRVYLAEMIGTFVLSSVVLVTLIPSAPFPVPTPIGAAMTLALYVYLVGSISGCHINPAISFAMWITGHMKTPQFLGYVLAQVIGGLLAFAMINGYVAPGAEQWLLPTGVTDYAGIGEAIGTAFFAFAVVSTNYVDYPPAIVGVVVGLALLVGITVSHNASYGVLNPAVALAAKAWVWQYLLAPFVGAAVGGFLSVAVFRSPKKVLQHA